MTGSILEKLRARTDRMVEDLAALVTAESPSVDLGATARCADVVDELGVTLLGRRAERVVLGGRTHLRWTFGTRSRVVLVGHFDTVWPVGTTARWGFRRVDDVASGPGAFDMKAGIVQMLHAVSALDDPDGVAIVLNSDEEVGSVTSNEMIRATVEGATAALVLEPSAGGALKTERKGVSHYQLVIKGRAAHAGLDPEKGINAGIELAHQVLALAELADPRQGTTVTPTLLTAGNSGNSVPARATMEVDARARTVAEQERVDKAVRALAPTLPGTTLQVEVTGHAPPLPHSAASALFAKAQEVGAALGLPPLTEASVGGGSDGNRIASVGIPVLDGLGAVGDLAHAEGEHVIVSAMPERAALVAALVEDLLKS